MLLDDGEKFKGQTARLLRALFPLFHRAFAGVEVAGEHRLTDVVALAQLLDLSRRECRWNREGGFIRLRAM